MATLPPAYTVRFWATQNYTGTHTIHVPAGVVYVLTDVDGYLRSTGTGTTEFIIDNGAGGLLVVLTGPSSGSVVFWRGRQMFGPGESIFLQCVTPADIAVTGYAFTGVSPYWPI